MAAEILMVPGEARDHASRMASAADEARDNFSRLRSELNALSDSFRGQAQAAFEARFAEWDGGANQVIDALDGLSQWLNQAADTIESVDSDIAGSLNS